ncbi:TetR/AcrR family transcriptional regulator [Pseudovibrio brasiliensis]|uniref:TetR/AcrR family transcriptional regulator n=1 Tax=Pseudovibrio brasiliensis TaxID=1898042 RepID=A0ABX8ANL3_9HYPH|nr:TetR/AcrR family transcriptional regulator [Pseudovibrio brasiliensis]QUS56158.1 TetR/AcrR family transcriptional regulator [Pseudovibrio brasiliensis]
MSEKTKAYQRARTAEHFAEREKMILTATRTLMDREGIENTSLSAVAREVGLAKSSLYRYYESREQILVALLLEDADHMLVSLQKALGTLNGDADLKTIAGIWAKVCCNHPRLCLLVSQLSPILEHNLSTERIVEAKQEFLRRHRKMAGILGTVLPKLSEAGALTAVQFVFTVIAGLWPMKAERKNTRAALEHPDLSHLKVNFEDSLAGSIELCLLGVLAKEQNWVPELK